MNLRQQLEELEGRRSAAYTDSEGYLTIGIGRLIDERRGGGLSDEEINFLFENDVKRCVRVLTFRLPWFLTLGEPRQAVLISMYFQMQDRLWDFVRALAAMRDARWAVAESEMLDSKWAKQTPERARRMARQMATGEWQ